MKNRQGLYILLCIELYTHTIQKMLNIYAKPFVMPPVLIQPTIVNPTISLQQQDLIDAAKYTLLYSGITAVFPHRHPFEFLYHSIWMMTHFERKWTIGTCFHAIEVVVQLQL